MIYSVFNKQTRTGNVFTTKTDAAREVGVTTRTITRWLAKLESYENSNWLIYCNEKLIKNFHCVRKGTNLAKKRGYHSN